MAVVTGCYCDADADLKIRGSFLNQNVPNVTYTSTKLENLVKYGADEINERLYRAGVKVPVASTYAYAFRRLTVLNSLWANANIEMGLSTRGVPSGGTKQTTSNEFKAEFERRITQYEENPKMLFAGDTDTDAYHGWVKSQPFTSQCWMATEEDDILCDDNFTIDDEF